MTRRRRWILGSLLGLPLVALAAVAALFLLLPRYDLAPYAAARATAALGRAVTIDSLRVVPGRTTTIEIRGARLANIPTGSAPEMATLDRLTATIELLPLLRGVVVLHQAEGEGFHLLLERDAERRRNWRFRGDPAGPPAPVPPEPPDRSALPLIGEIRLTSSSVTFRTSSGTPLRTEIASASLAAPAPDQPLRLLAEGAYNAAPLRLEGTLGTPEQFRAGRTPFPTVLRATSGEAALTLDGTMEDPLNFDRIDARIHLTTPRLGILSAIGGGPDTLPAALELRGKGTRLGDLWRITDATGALDGAPLTLALAELAEGSPGQPDAITLEGQFARLDLNRLLGTPPAGAGGEPDDADLPLRTFADPDPLLRVRLSAEQFAYARFRGREGHIVAAVVPGRIEVEALAVTAWGGRIEGNARLDAHEAGGRITALASLQQGELEALRRAFGIRPLPLTGRVDARVSVAAEGATLNQATRRATIAAVVAMRGGAIGKEVIEMASTDIRALFRTNSGSTPLTCLLAVASMRAGRGEAAPLRLRAATGTISGIAAFDLNRETLDLVIGSERSTTSGFALDIPVRVSGSFADPDIAPASWSREGRARLAAGDRVAPLPGPLRDFARSSPCFRGG
jgi:hypothetical protein